jgi:RNA polymerase sigma-70 factor (ECF subfamily)
VSERTDEEVVAAWQSGDERAFDEVVDRFTRRVFGICHRYFGEATDAEEATQETFVTLYRRGSSFRGQSRFSTWLYRVATNVCHDIGRKRARRVDTVPLDERPGGAPGEQTPSTDAEDALVAAELGAEITTALRGLDIDQRTARRSPGARTWRSARRSPVSTAHMPVWPANSATCVTRPPRAGNDPAATSI